MPAIKLKIIEGKLNSGSQKCGKGPTGCQIFRGQVDYASLTLMAGLTHVLRF